MSIFSNRLLGIAQCAGIVGCANALANVGSVNSNGAELAVSWHVVPGVTWYNSGTFDRSLYGDALVTGGVSYDTKGKQIVDTPEFMYKSELSYEHNGFYAHLTGDYMGPAITAIWPMLRWRAASWSIPASAMSSIKSARCMTCGRSST